MEMKIHCRHDKLIPIDSLRPYPKNRNRHTDEQIARLALLLKYQGIRSPIVVVRNVCGVDYNLVVRGICIAKGHGTVEAIRFNGWKEVPVVYQDFDDEEQLYAYVQSDNAIAAWAELDLSGINADVGDLGPDFDIDWLGIKDFTLDVAEKGHGDPDAVPETPKEAKTKRGELWTLGEHRLLCGDATSREDVERLMAGEKAGCVVTSPPYSDLREYKIGSFDWLALMNGAFDGMALSAGEDASLLVNLGQTHKDRRVNFYWDPWLKYAEQAGWPCFGLYIWDKMTAVPGDWNGRLAPRHEFVFHFTNSKRPHVAKWIETKGGEAWGRKSTRQKDGSLKVGFNSPDKTGQTYKIPDSIIEITCEKNNKTGHPAVFPVRFPEYLLKTFARPSDNVYEPFSGSGSTLIACEKTSRRCFGMEIEPIYVDVILSRWAKFTGKDPVREDGVKWSELQGARN